MFKAQMKYWNDMMKTAQENFQESMKKGAAQQNAFPGFFKDMMDLNYKTAIDFQKEVVQFNTKMMERSADQMKKINDAQARNFSKTVETMNKLFDQYNVKNDDLRKEMEKLWKESSADSVERLREIMEIVAKAWNEDAEIIMKSYKDNMEAGLEELRRRMESFSKTEPVAK